MFSYHKRTFGNHCLSAFYDHLIWKVGWTGLRIMVDINVPSCREKKAVLKNLVAQTVKTLPAMQETQVQSLGGEDALEKEKASQSSILAWVIPWTEEPGGIQAMGSQRVGHH